MIAVDATPHEIESLPAPVPEASQLVHVRDRHWLVVEVIPSAMPLEASSGLEARPQHLVTLSSVDDDGLDDRLSVIWELELDGEVLVRTTLPDPARGVWDEPDRLHAFLDAVRWGAIASADAKALQAPFRSGITIEDYQLDPVVRALDMPRVNLLIADDVGLGKTIEAGLVMQELLLRHRARRVIILCPPALRLKWRREMQEKFGVAFEVIDSERLRTLRRERGVGANAFRRFQRVIVSFDWLKDGRPLELLREMLPREDTYPRTFDLLILDEAHQCAPSGRDGLYATDSKRMKLLEQLSPHVEHRLFLSATPHNGYESSYSALLSLLDPQRFARGVKPDEASTRRAVVRRMKAQIDEDLGPRPDGTVRFPRREVLALPVAYATEERDAHAKLAAYAQSRRERAKSSRNDASTTACDLVTLLLKKRLFSSPAAFATTLEAHLRTLKAGGTANVPGAERVRAAFDELDDDFDADDDLDDATEDALVVAARASERITDAERALLTDLRRWSDGAVRRADAKATLLIAKLREWCRTSTTAAKAAWTNERVIIFTEYRATQNWLHGLLIDAGLDEKTTFQGHARNRLELLYGGMDDDERQRIVDEFAADPTLTPVRILLATDTASEGIDLQHHCRRMIHVEIPFNPNRLEQRNGRIDRHGQPSPTVEIYHFVGAGFAAAGTLDGDLEFLSRAARKVEQIKADLGDAGTVLAREVERAMLGYGGDVEAASVAVGTSSSRATLKRIDRDLRERIATLRARLDESVAELGIQPENVRRAVDAGLALGRQAPLVPIELAQHAASTDRAYAVPELTRSWAGAAVDLYDELRGERRPIVFDGTVAQRREDVVAAHLGHPLVAQALRLLRAEMWATGEDATLARVSGGLVSDDALAEPSLLVHARLVVMGADGVRLHEELFTAGGRIGPSGFARYNVGETQRAARAERVGKVPKHHQAAFAAAWPGIEEAVRGAVEARERERSQSLEGILRKRADEDVAALREVLGELRASIEAELRRIERNEAEQLRLFADARESERRQFTRDVEALRARVDELPGEAEREAERLRRRYAGPRALVFPAAIELLVPRRFAERSLDLPTRTAAR